MITTAVMALTNLKIAFTKRAQPTNLPAKTLNASAINTDAMVKTTVVTTQTKSIAVSFFRIFSLWFLYKIWCWTEKENTTCPNPTQFRCNNGQCIDGHLVCNKVADCTDESDEPAHCNVDECAKVEIHQCGHKCVDTLTGYYCECNQGYK